ncbi:MAG TPA: hypothetical protein ENG85_03650 [Bacteroidetes bacterium]|nr:hypothetical protein [Bacteroidota bacterium]
MNQLGLYRLINIPVDAQFAPVVIFLLLVAVGVAAAVAIVFVFWVAGIDAPDDNRLGPSGIFSGQLLPEIKTLEIAEKLGSETFKNKVIERMKLDAKNALLKTTKDNNGI